MARKENFSVGILDVDYIRGGGIDPFTKRFYVDPVNGSDGNDGKTITRAKKTFTAGYNLLTTAKNEVLYAVAGATGMVQTSALTWAKSNTHLISLSPQRMNNRSRISTVTAAAMTPLMTWSGANCIISNILFSQEGSHATGNAVPLYITGHRNYLENVHTRNIGALAVVDNSHRSLKLGSIYDTFFVKCQFGETSYDAVTAASYVIEFSGTDSGKFVFEDCIILGAGSSSASFLYMPANVGGFTMFKRCLFHNSTISSLDAMTQAFNISGTGNDGVFLMDCIVSGATNLETSDSGVLFGRNADAAATGQLAVALTG